MTDTQFVKVASHGFIQNGDKFLITQRPLNDDYMPGFWDTPGGTIEFGEKALDALTREIKEETGLTVKTGKLIFCYDYLSSPQRHQFNLVYQCDYLSGEIILDPNEHCEYRWVTLEQAKQIPNLISFLKELVNYLQPDN